jgi:pimeloyl-ACP methyl ester carboxylesterase
VVGRDPGYKALVTATIPSTPVQRLVARYDPELFTPMRTGTRIRLVGIGDGPRDQADVVFEADRAFLVDRGGRPDAILTADPQTWDVIASDVRGGLDAFRAGRLKVRRDLHLGVGFLAATADEYAPGRPGLRFSQVPTAIGELSVNEAGDGPPVILLHGLGATKVSLLPTVAALASTHRAIAVDLPGFGDSVKPIRSAYDARFFARAVVALLDALGLERADVVGNSMGGRIALELGLSHPERVGRLGLLAPSLAWLRGRPWAPLLRLVDPRLGLLQPAPRPLVEAIVRHVVPGAQEEWTAAGIDEFLRSYLTARGRAAFYAAARNIYLEAPYGPRGLWSRLPELAAPSLFVWGRQDHLVPIGFERHVREALPSAFHLELDCGHVPQLEAPAQTHEALLAFLGA